MSTRGALNEIQPTRRSRRSSAPLGDITNRESQSSHGSKDAAGNDGKAANKRASKRKSTKVTASENEENAASNQNSEDGSNPPPARRRKNENTKSANTTANSSENNEEMDQEISDENANPNVNAGADTSVEHVFVGQVADEQRYAKYKERESKILERRRTSSDQAAATTADESNRLTRQSSEVSTSSIGNISAMSGNSSTATVNSNDGSVENFAADSVVAPVAPVPPAVQHLELLPSHVIPKKAPHTIHRPIPLKTKNVDPSQCVDIIDIMYESYHRMQPEYAAVPYMDRQPDINKKMRAILVDWLVEVHLRFKLEPLTLWLTVNILDRYLMREQVLRAKLQLVGISSLLIACKYEEIFPPAVSDCVSITDKAYNKEQILQMESRILMTLEYAVFVPTGYHFLCRYLNAIGAPERTRNLAYYYAERNLQEYDSLQNDPHVMAAGALYAALLKEDQLTQFVENKPTVFWNNTLVIETGLRASDLVYLAKNMVKHVSEEPETASKRRLIACKKKFSHEKFSSVSTMSLPLFNVVL